MFFMRFRVEGVAIGRSNSCAFLVKLGPGEAEGGGLLHVLLHVLLHILLLMLILIQYPY